MAEIFLVEIDIGFDYDATEKVGAFSTRDKAQAFIDEVCRVRAKIKEWETIRSSGGGPFGDQVWAAATAKFGYDRRKGPRNQIEMIEQTPFTGDMKTKEDFLRKWGPTLDTLQAKIDHQKATDQAYSDFLRDETARCWNEAVPELADLKARYDIDVLNAYCFDFINDTERTKIVPMILDGRDGVSS